MASVVLATAGYDHTIRFWEATSGICYRTLQYADSQVNKLEITSDKTQLAAAGNPQIRIFDVNSNDPQPVNSFDGHNGNVSAVGFQKDTKWMFSGEAPMWGGARGDGAGLVCESGPAWRVHGCRGAGGLCTVGCGPTGQSRAGGLERRPPAMCLTCLPLVAARGPHRGRGRHGARVGPARPRVPAHVREQGCRQHRGAAPQPGGTHLRWAWWACTRLCCHAPAPPPFTPSA